MRMPAPVDVLGLASRVALAAAVYATGTMVTGEHLPKLSPEAAHSLLEQSDSKAKALDFKGALPPLLRLLASNPDNHNYLSREAEIYGGLKDYRREAAAWELFMAVAPFPTDACPNLGKAYAKAGQDDKALQAHERCLALDPTKPDLQFFLARAYEMRDRSQAAERLYLKILSTAPKYFDASLGLARLLMSERRDSEAEKLVSAVVSESKENPDALLLWARLADNQGRRELAKQRILQAIASSPSYADLYRILGRWYDRDGDRAGSLRIYSTLHELEPEDPVAKTRLAEFQGRAP